MPAITTFGLTGNNDIDVMVRGRKWAVLSLTFSFPTAASNYGDPGVYGAGPGAGFCAVSEAMKTAIRAILAYYSTIIPIEYTEMEETDTEHADIRFACTTETGGPAFSHYPNASAFGGDTWFRSDDGAPDPLIDNPVKGNYAWFVILHEHGHGLGLKHPHEDTGGWPIMSADDDALQHTVMSYRSYIGMAATGNYTNGADSYPQSLMWYDIQALQHMYGAAPIIGNTTYRWDETTAEKFTSVNGGAEVGHGVPAGNKVFEWVYGHGGVFDAILLDGTPTALAAGAWLNTGVPAQLPNLGGGTAPGMVGNAGVAISGVPGLPIPYETGTVLSLSFSVS